MLLKILTWLVKIGLLKKPKEYLYTVHTKVYLDGNLIKQFPSEVLATSRRKAKYDIESRVQFKTGTTALGAEWEGKKRNFYVQLYVMFDFKIIHSFAAKVLASKRREAKFDITKRLKFKTGAAVKKSDLLKYNKK